MMISQTNTLNQVARPEPMIEIFSMRDIFTWEIGALVSLLFLGMTMQIGSGLLGFVAHPSENTGAHSTEMVYPTCSEEVVTQ